MVKRRWVVAALLTLSLAAWSVQLGGVAALQAGCRRASVTHSRASGPPRPDHAITYAEAQELLAQAAAALKGMQGLKNPPGSALARAVNAQQQLLAGYLMQRPGAEAGDGGCALFYRYQWLNVGLQLLVLCYAWYALFRYPQQARTGVCCALAVAVLLSVEDARTVFHAIESGMAGTMFSGETMVLFIGCVVTCCADLALLFVMGVDDRAIDRDEWHPLPTSLSRGAHTQLGRAVSQRKGEP